MRIVITATEDARLRYVSREYSPELGVRVFHTVTTVLERFNEGSAELAKQSEEAKPQHSTSAP